MTDREFKPFSFKRMPEDLHRRLKTLASSTGNGLENLILEVLTSYVEKNERSKK